jgi:hypothetical protein
MKKDVKIFDGKRIKIKKLKHAKRLIEDLVNFMIIEGGHLPESPTILGLLKLFVQIQQIEDEQKLLEKIQQIEDKLMEQQKM